jgi:hypothetical protein
MRKVVPYIKPFTIIFYFKNIFVFDKATFQSKQVGRIIKKIKK